MLRSLGSRLLLAAAKQAAGRGGAGATCGWPASAAGAAGAAAATEAQLASQEQARRLAAAYVQRAGIRTRHAKHPPHVHTGGRASALRRVLRVVGRTAAATAVGLPLAGVAALAWKGREEGADVWDVLHSLPRTARIVWWGGWATYKASAAERLVLHVLP